ncbi:MAG: ATP-binding protein [Oscillospiraceae bacterium]|nr:ATP-binding protein [Oscillospiraceae bacterium]
MKKRIARSMGLLICLTVLVFAALWGFLSAGVFSSQIMSGLRTLRVSLIDATGAVIYDNRADPETMENHLDRPEVRDALQNGRGESERFSDTLGETTRYYAMRTADGNVLRLALTTDNMARIMRGFIPVVLICLLLAACLALYISRRLTRRITDPLNSLDLDAPELTEYDELLPLMKKIAEQKREIAAQIVTLKHRADTIEAITGHMKEGMILMDEAGAVLMANKSAADVFGENDMPRKNILHICRDIDFGQGVKQCLAGTGAEMEFEHGGRVYHIYFSPVRDGDALTGGVILLFDITERYEAEKQRREFSANVSHELKTPLTSISALAEMIENGMAKPEDVRGFAEKISVQARRLVSIIEDIIRLSEFDEGKIIREDSEFDLCELTESVIEALRGKAEEKRVAVRVTGGELRVTASRRMMDELLYNLIDNAIKYNTENGEVTVSLSAENGFAKIAVTDTGIGISGEHRHRVFERFYRVDKSRSKKTGGTGLGLSIVKHIAEHHGGRVELESAGGTGTTVVCWLRSPAPAAGDTGR